MDAKFIVLDGKQVVLDRATGTLRDAFELTNTPYRDGLLVGIIKGRKDAKTGRHQGICGLHKQRRDQN